MTKKIIGICLIVVGLIFVGWTSFSLHRTLTTNPDDAVVEVKRLLAESNTPNYLSDEELKTRMEKDSQFFTTFSIVIILIGAGIAFGGYMLFRKGQKENEIPDAFNFE